jgi:Cu(I)/Ag(I) efflux system membrane fusion protein
MFVTVTITSPLDAGGHGSGREDPRHGHMHEGGVLAVPRSAVINTGTRTVAFVELEPGRYTLREVTIGAMAEGYLHVLTGLEEGERVVERGSFLLDSQTQLTGEAAEIYGGALGKESRQEDEHRQHRH